MELSDTTSGTADPALNELRQLPIVQRNASLLLAVDRAMIAGGVANRAEAKQLGVDISRRAFSRAHDPAYTAPERRTGRRSKIHDPECVAAVSLGPANLLQTLAYSCICVPLCCRSAPDELLMCCSVCCILLRFALFDILLHIVAYI